MNVAAKINAIYMIIPYATTPSGPISFNNCILYKMFTSDMEIFDNISEEPLKHALPMGRNFIRARQSRKFPVLFLQK